MIFQQLDGSVTRAYEIALAGKHSICLLTFYPNLRQYIREIKSILPDVTFTDNPSEADIIVEVVAPNFEATNSPRAVKDRESISEAVNRAFKSTGLYPVLDLTDSNYNLLKVASSRLSLTPIDVERIKLVAKTIAALSDSDVVRIEHLAEAIHYQAYDRPEVSTEEISLDIPEDTTIDQLDKVRDTLDSYTRSHNITYRFGDSTIHIQGLEPYQVADVCFNLGKLIVSLN